MCHIKLLRPHPKRNFCINCLPKARRERERLLYGIKVVDPLTCPVCGFMTSFITTQHIKEHGFLTPEDFKKEFNLPYLQSESFRKVQSERNSKNNPMMKGHTKESKDKISKNRTGKGIGIVGKYVRTPEIRAKISVGVAQAYIEGRLITSSYPKGNAEWVRSKKAGLVFVRSSWEKRILKILDLHPYVLAVEYEPCRISYEFEGRTKSYIPDFLVYFDGMIKELWEIKPDYLIKDSKNLAKTIALNEYIKRMNYNGRIVDLAQIENMEREVGILPWNGKGHSWSDFDNSAVKTHLEYLKHFNEDLFEGDL